MQKIFDIHERIYQFVLSVMQLIQKVPKSLVNLVIIKQLSRAITSVGANDQEADGVSSKADFIHCNTIVRKELKESVFWLRILGDLNFMIKANVQKEITEGKELIKIISKIIINTKSKVS